MAWGKKRPRVCVSALCMTGKHTRVLLPLQKVVKLLFLLDKHFRRVLVAEVSTWARTHTQTHTQASEMMMDLAKIHM